jgi:hypothetical protein
MSEPLRSAHLDRLPIPKPIIQSFELKSIPFDVATQRAKFLLFQ